MPPAFAPVEQDPWRNARGLNAMFASRGGPPLWPFLIAAVGLLAFVGLRIAAARQAAEQRDAILALDRDLSEQHAFDPPHVDPWSDPVARDTIGGGPSEAQIRAEAERVCGKLATCGGQPGAVDVVDNCVAQDMALANGIDGRQMVHELLDGIDSACSAKPCDEYVGCYFDRVKAFGDKAGLSSTELTPAERARMEALTCELAAKYGGKPPSLDDPSPEVRELDALLTKAGPAAADMMKDAVAHCGGPAASAAPPGAGISTSVPGSSARTGSTRR